MVSWWSDEDFSAFSELNDQVMPRYSSLEVAPGLFVDGELTVTENVADMGGLHIAYDAMLIALNLNGQEDTPWFLSQQQRFFLAASRNWREVQTPEYLELLVSVDSHAPVPVRGVEPLRHIDAFSEAFANGPDDPEYLPPEQRIVIWYPGNGNVPQWPFPFSSSSSKSSSRSIGIDRSRFRTIDEPRL